MSRRTDRLLLLDIVEAIDDASAFLQGLSLEEFVADRRTFHAVCRCLEIIGEAAGRLQRDTMKSMPDVPWQQVRGIRNRIVHAYFAIDGSIVYEVVTKDMPDLRAAIQAAYPEIRLK